MPLILDLHLCPSPARPETLVLARPLPPDVHRCIVNYRPDRLGGHRIAIDCT